MKKREEAPDKKDIRLKEISESGKEYYKWLTSRKLQAASKKEFMIWNHFDIYIQELNEKIKELEEESE